MSLKGFLVKVGDKLIPATEDDRKAIFSLSDGEIIPFNLNNNRKIWRNRKYWLMLQKVFEYLPEEILERISTKEKLHNELKTRLGYFETQLLWNGQEIIIIGNKVGSTSFENMGEKEFTDYVFKVKELLLNFYLFGIDSTTFDKEFMTLIFD